MLRVCIPQFRTPPLKRPYRRANSAGHSALLSLDLKKRGGYQYVVE